MPIVRDADRREGERFDPACLVSGTTADGIKMNTDKDRVFVLVRDFYSLLKSEELVRLPGHYDLEPKFTQVVTEHARNLEIIIRFGAEMIDGTCINAPVAGINDHGIKRSCGFDRGWK